MAGLLIIYTHLPPFKVSSPCGEDGDGSKLRRFSIGGKAEEGRKPGVGAAFLENRTRKKAAQKWQRIGCSLFTYHYYSSLKKGSPGCLFACKRFYFLFTSPSTLPARLYSRKVTREFMPPLHRLKGIMMGHIMAFTASAGIPL